MAWRERFRDSAYASNIPLNWTGGVAGYINGGDPFHVWSKGDWARFPKQRKLPILVQSYPSGAAEGESNAFQALHDLYNLGVPKGVYIAIDYETAENAAYARAFDGVISWGGYIPLAYGSSSTVFNNPAKFYWVANYVSTGPFMYSPDPAGGRVIMTQYADPSHGSGGQWDSSTCRWWQYFKSSRWWV